MIVPLIGFAIGVAAVVTFHVKYGRKFREWTLRKLLPSDYWHRVEAVETLNEMCRSLECRREEMRAGFRELEASYLRGNVSEEQFKAHTDRLLLFETRCNIHIMELQCFVQQVMNGTVDSRTLFGPTWVQQAQDLVASTMIEDGWTPVFDNEGNFKLLPPTQDAPEIDLDEELQEKMSRLW